MKATFAGGCFWCIETAFVEFKGVVKVEPGYAGGEEVNPTYEQVAMGRTGHREAVQVEYDPGLVSYEDLVEQFLRQIDPTDAEGQFADRGFHYTTAIFYHSEEQKVEAEKVLVALKDSGKFEAEIAVKVLPYSTFYPAEDYHVHYAQKNPQHYERYKWGSGRGKFIEEKWKTRV